MLAFTVPGVPVAKERPRATNRAGFISLYTPKKTAAFERKCGVYARRAMGDAPLMEGPLSLSIKVYVPIPASWSKKQKANALAGVFFPTGKPDLSNYQKALEDGINGIVWVDDSQVIESYGVKVYSDRPRLAVAISQYEGDDE